MAISGDELIERRVSRRCIVCGFAYLPIDKDTRLEATMHEECAVKFKSKRPRFDQKKEKQTGIQNLIDLGA